MKFNLFYLLIFLSSSFQAIAQVKNSTDTSSTKETLPFAIADEKKLSEEDLQNKKEGTYITGVPELSSDPINGFGYGAEVEIFFNGKRKDPFFAYTPYRKRLNVVLFNTTNAQRELLIGIDIPYIFNTKWRLRAEAAYEVNPNLLYFGINEQTLNALSYYQNGDSTKAPVTNASYSNYENSLTGANSNYNRYQKQELIFNASLEHSFFDSKVRLLAGYEIADVTITPFSGNSFVKNDYDAGKIVGLYQGTVSIIQAGIVYDTRDLETDPTRGIFAEITNEFSNQAIGSKYNFNKTFVHAKAYQQLLPQVFKKMILATRVGMGYTAGEAPFFEYQDQWSSEGSMEGLGGPNTIRGYKQSRFLARAMSFYNIELRTRFFQTNIFKQHLSFSAVPFFDIGSVGNTLGNMFNASNFRSSEGLGLRIIWNSNTILRFDYAVSKEDKQFFFNLGHTF